VSTLRVAISQIHLLSLLSLSPLYTFGIGVCCIGHQFYTNLDTEQADCVTQIRVLTTRVLDFKKRCGHLPSEAVGLKALEQPSLAGCKIEPLIEKVPVDPWDKEFTYLLKGDKAYLLSSQPACGVQLQNK
jgi:hypothetical protein